MTKVGEGPIPISLLLKRIFRKNEYWKPCQVSKIISSKSNCTKGNVQLALDSMAKRGEISKLTVSQQHSYYGNHKTIRALKKEWGLAERGRPKKSKGR